MSQIPIMHKSIKDTIDAVAACDLAVEIGSVNTRAYARGRGSVLHEPSLIVTMREEHGERIVCVGREAQRMLQQNAGAGRHIAPAWPKEDGFFCDDTVAEAILRHVFMKTTIPNRLLLFVPHSITKVEERALRSAALAAGAGGVVMLSSALALAVSDALKHSIHIPRVVVSIGGHTTEAAVVTRDGVVYSKITRLGGRTMREAVTAYFKRRYNLLIDEALAEKIRIRLTSAWPASFERTVNKALAERFRPTALGRKMKVRGRDVVTGIAQTVTVCSDEISETNAPLIEKIIEAMNAAFEEAPPELVCAILDNGVLLTGGGSRLHGLERRIQAEGVPVVRQENVLAKLFRK